MKDPIMSENPVFTQIRNELESNDVVLFMKGTAKIPQCGFSSTVAQVLRHLGVEFKDINVLADPELREGIKAFSDWPTIPQLYIKGEFIGGADITREMFQSGELQQMLKDNNIPFNDQAATA
jgi:monothiol glutaredoxin